MLALVDNSRRAVAERTRVGGRLLEVRAIGTAPPYGGRGYLVSYAEFVQRMTNETTEPGSVAERPLQPRQSLSREERAALKLLAELLGAMPVAAEGHCPPTVYAVKQAPIWCANGGEGCRPQTPR